MKNILKKYSKNIESVFNFLIFLGFLVPATFLLMRQEFINGAITLLALAQYMTFTKLGKFEKILAGDK